MSEVPTAVTKNILQVDNTREVIGTITKEMLEMHPELKAVFGVKMVPNATMLSMPKLGAHVKAVNDLFETVSCMGIF